MLKLNIFIILFLFIYPIYGVNGIALVLFISDRRQLYKLTVDLLAMQQIVQLADERLLFNV